MPMWLAIICLVIAMAFLDQAITGRTFSHGRGGQRSLIAEVRLVPLKVGLSVAGIGVIVWIVGQFLRRFHV
jgi:hypothetical protein